MSEHPQKRAIEPTLLLWLATDRGLVSRHLLNQSRNPIQGLLVGNANGDALLMHNLAIEFVALDAHGSPLRRGREPAELSVTDDCRAPSGDGRMIDQNFGSRHLELWWV
jgi:hypothetical protein